MLLKGKNIHLRALEPYDLDFLYQIENNTKLWNVSSTQTPFSKHILQQYLANAHQDIYEAKQLRLVIATTKPVGFIDVFDFNPQHKRAGIGIVVIKEEQHKGFASDALKVLIDYLFLVVDLHQVFANITSDNLKSIALFEKHGFKKIGIKKEWTYFKGNYTDEILYQKLK